MFSRETWKEKLKGTNENPWVRTLKTASSTFIHNSSLRRTHHDPKSDSKWWIPHMRKNLEDKLENPLWRNSATAKSNKRCKEPANKPKKHYNNQHNEPANKTKPIEQHNRNTISTWITRNQRKRTKPHCWLKDPELQHQWKIGDDQIWDFESPLIP